MLRFCRSSFNGVQDLLFIHGFRQLVLYSTSIESNPNLAKYLVENLGFSRQKALSTSSKLARNRLRAGAKNVIGFNFVNNVDSVIAFLRKFGLEQSRIRTVISIYPQILLSSVDKTLIPKTEALQKLGFSRKEIADVVSVKPKILWMSLKNSIIPAIKTMRDVMGGDAHVILMLKHSREYNLSVVAKQLGPNVAILRSYGIPIKTIRNFLVKSPSTFLQKTDHFQDIVIGVQEKFGIPVDSPRFLACVHTVATSSQKTIESKMQIYKSFGWTDSHIAALVSLNPCILGLCQDTIKKKLDFLMNEVGFEPSFLASRCNLLSLSLEKRIKPRHKVLVALKENGLVMRCSLPSVVCYSESKFVNRFVLPFKEVHEVYSKFAGNKFKMLSRGLSERNSSAL